MGEAFILALLAGAGLGWLRDNSPEGRRAREEEEQRKRQKRLEKDQEAERKRLAYERRPDVALKRAEDDYVRNLKIAAKVRDPMARQMAELAAQRKYYADLMRVISGE